MELPKRVVRRIEHLIGLLGHTDDTIAGRAETHLIRFYAVRAAEQLAEAARSTNPLVRCRVAIILPCSRDPRAFEIIASLLGDPIGFVRYDSAIALGKLGDTRAIAPLIELMSSADDADCANSAAAHALVLIGMAAVPELVSLLSSAPGPTRRRTAYVLGGIGDKRAIEPLAALLTDEDGDTRIAGIESLAEIGSTRCLELIEPLLDDPVERVRRNAAAWRRTLTSGHRKT